MLRNHLVRMQPSLGPEASCSGSTRQGDRIREPETQTLARISETKVSEHNSISYWDEATVRSLKLLAWPRNLLQSILQTAGTGRRGPGLVSTFRNRSLREKGKVFYGQEPPSGESTTTESGVNYQLLSVMH